jgi:hypothetical protein
MAATVSAVLAAPAAPQPADGALANKPQIAANYARLPLSFETNRGQADKRVRFISRGSGYSLFLTDSAAVLALGRQATKIGKPERAMGSRIDPASASNDRKTDVVRMELVGASRDLRVTGQEQLPGTANYFIGSDPAQWRTNVPSYAKVSYSKIYPGIDLVFYGNQGQLEYDFVVAPGADPKPIRLRFSGAKGLRLTANGDLTVSATNGEIAFHKPVVHQNVGGQRQSIPGRFTLLAGKTAGFLLGSYDHSQPLVIDPVLAYSTYLGGSGYKLGYGDSVNAISVDANGYVYVAGAAVSADFPVSEGALQTENHAKTGHINAFVTKLNPTGTAVDYSTYLGGSGNDNGVGLAVDGFGYAYITGYTYSTNFPVTKGAFQTTNRGAANKDANAFVTKLNPSGKELVYSTYLGGSEGEGAAGLAVDGSGAAYIAGNTFSTDFPVTQGAFQTKNPAAANKLTDAFVTKLDPAGSALVYSTYLGGSGDAAMSDGDAAYALAVDDSGNAYITGSAGSTDFPVTKGAFQDKNLAAANGESNAFVTKLNPVGTDLVYSTYLGGSGIDDVQGYGDWANALAVDGSGNAYIAGQAESADFPVTSKAFQTKNHAADSEGINAFVTKLDPAGSALVYSTYLGGSVPCKGAFFSTMDAAYGLAVDGFGNAYVTGLTTSIDFPVTKGAFQTTNHVTGCGASNAFVTKLNQTGRAPLVYSTYLGGSGFSVSNTVCGDGANALALNGGNVYVAGFACSANFPVTANAYQTKNHAAAIHGYDAFVVNLDMSATTPAKTATKLTASKNPAAKGVSVTFTAEVMEPLGSEAPAGSVVFAVDGKVAATVTLDVGRAMYSVSSLAVGKHNIEASYGGGNAYAASSASLSETITAKASTPVFSPAAGTYNAAQSVTLTDATKNATIYYTTNKTTPSTSSTEYTKAIEVSQTTTIKAIAVATGYSQSAVASATYTIAPPAPAPTFSPAAGTYTAAQTVKIADKETTGLKIYYTTNGSKPSTSSTLYTSAGVKVSATTTIKAIAVATGYSQSAVASATYTIAPPAPAPTFSPAAGTYTAAQTVKIADKETAGLKIYYTTNGTKPTTSSTLYTSAGVKVSATETIKAIAVATGYSQSAVASATYTITPPAPAPTFSPAAGTYTAAQTVKIADKETTGLKIYYTTNGTKPTTSSTLYTSAGVKVSATETIKAIAVATGYSQSAVASATYTIAPPALGPGSKLQR